MINAENSKHLTRQMDIIPLDCLEQEITIIGAGAIGSFSVFALTKMGFQNITVWDFDNVEEENINSQIYRFSDIGRPKVEALKDIIKDAANVEINIENRRYEDRIFPGIVISAVDNMETRKKIWRAHKKHNNTITKLIIDPRMAIEFANVQAIDLSDKKEYKIYETTLFSDEDALPEKCTNKSTCYTAQLVGSTVAKIIKDFVTKNKYYKRLLWDIKNNEIFEYSMSA